MGQNLKDGKGCALQLYATNQCDIVADRHAILSEQIADPQPLLRGIEDERVQFIEKQIIGSANTGAPDNAMRTEGYVMMRGNVKCFKPVTTAGPSPLHLVIIGMKLQFRTARELMSQSG